MMWECEYCKKEFEEYLHLCRHLRICTERPLEIRNYSAAPNEEEHGSCMNCMHVSLLPDEYPCNMCINNETHHRIKIPDNVLLKKTLSKDHPFHGGVANENLTVILFKDIKDPFAKLGCTKDEFNIIITPEEMQLESVYPEFLRLMKYTEIGKPSYYLLKNHRWPMIAVYVREGGDSYYFVAPVTDTPINLKAEKAGAING